MVSEVVAVETVGSAWMGFVVVASGERFRRIGLRSRLFCLRTSTTVSSVKVLCSTCRCGGPAGVCVTNASLCVSVCVSCASAAEVRPRCASLSHGAPGVEVRGEPVLSKGDWRVTPIGVCVRCVSSADACVSETIWIRAGKGSSSLVVADGRFALRVCVTCESESAECV